MFGWPGCCCDTGPPTVPTPNCMCDEGPAVIYMKSTRPDLNSDIFKDDTITWQARPAWASVLSISDPGYYGNVWFTEPGHGDQFIYHISCVGAETGLHRVFEHSFFAGGGPLLDSVRYRWTASLAGNSCDPFYLLHGSIYSGGNPAGKVYLSAFAGDWKIGSKFVQFTVFNSTTPFARIAGATVTCDGVSETTNADGLAFLTLTQSASGRAFTVTAPGKTATGGTVAGSTPVATEAQTDGYNVPMS